MSGIPITVTRTYDTLNAGASDDFGFGWRLDFRDINVQSSIAPTGMEADGFYNPFSDNTRVYFTVPGDKREGFLSGNSKVAEYLASAVASIL